MKQMTSSSRPVLRPTRCLRGLLLVGSLLAVGECRVRAAALDPLAYTSLGTLNAGSNGTFTADGTAAPTGGGAGGGTNGPGGGLFLQAGSLSTSGSLNAAGGSGDTSYLCGGGGARLWLALATFTVGSSVVPGASSA